MVVRARTSQVDRTLHAKALGQEEKDTFEKKRKCVAERQLTKSRNAGAFHREARKIKQEQV